MKIFEMRGSAELHVVSGPQSQPRDAWLDRQELPHHQHRKREEASGSYPLLANLRFAYSLQTLALPLRAPLVYSW